MKIHQTILAAVIAFLVWTPVTTWAAVTVNLTTAGATATPTAVIGGVFRVEQIDPQSTGTGVIDSFVRIQDNGNEEGYNTDLGTPLDTKAGNFTHSLLLSSVPIVDIGGTLYRQFLLDINQNTGGDNEFITLNQIQIFLAPSDMLHTGLIPAGATTPPEIAFAGTTEVFRMNEDTNTGFTQILMDYSLNAGSGSGDMFLYVLNSAFTGLGTQNLILYSQFGDDPDGPGGAFGNGGTNDGFEEWAVLLPEGSPDPNPPPSLPEPTSLAIWCLGLVAAGFGARRMRKQK